MPIRIALVGDYDRKSIAHQAIPRALDLAGKAISQQISFDWKHTASLASLDAYQGIWCVPGSPYASESNVLSAIKRGRETGVPFLGTCGGFQHAVLEFARNGIGLSGAQHAEVATEYSCLVISRLACSLVETEQTVIAVPGTRMWNWYGSQPMRFGYHCNFGLNTDFEGRLEAGGMRVSARDETGAARAIEVQGYPFFVGTLFQPERQALEGIVPLIVKGFVEAASASA